MNRSIGAAARIPAILLTAGSLVLSACQGEGPGVSPDVGTVYGDPPPPPEPVESTAERTEREAREAATRQIAVDRSHAIDALNRAQSDLIHNCARGSLSDDQGPVRLMLRRIANQRTRMQTLANEDVAAGYAETRVLLDEAYTVAQGCGAVSPAVYGQRNADETWWYISSP